MSSQIPQDNSRRDEAATTDDGDTDGAALLKRERLTEDLPRRGTSMFANPRGGILFGLAFVISGVLLILVGCKVIPVQRSSVHGPYWALAALGACFAAAGLVVCGKSLRQARRAGLLRRMQLTRPEAPWLGDYPWCPDGYYPPRWQPVFSNLLAAGFLALFAAPFNWLGFFAARGGGWPARIAAGFVDMLIFFVLLHTLYRCFQALRVRAEITLHFGGSAGWSVAKHKEGAYP